MRVPVPPTRAGGRLEVLAGAGPGDARLCLVCLSLVCPPLHVWIPCCYPSWALPAIAVEPCNALPARRPIAAHPDLVERVAERVVLRDGSGWAVDFNAVPRLAEQLIRLGARLYLQCNSVNTLTTTPHSSASI